MSKGSIELVVTSGRTLSQGRTMEKGKVTQEYADAVELRISAENAAEHEREARISAEHAAEKQPGCPTP